MSTVTGTLTINAAFLHEIKEDNRELRELLSHAVAVFDQPPPAHAPAKQLAELLADLRDRLAMHFSLEEAFGYFDDAVSVAPRLNREADALRAQHAEIFQDVCNLVEKAEQLQYGENGRSAAEATRRLAERFQAFYHRFQDHESRENQLILEALDDDIGVGD